jgi:hypothetical protein
VTPTRVEQKLFAGVEATEEGRGALDNFCLTESVYGMRDARGRGIVDGNG